MNIDATAHTHRWTGERRSLRTGAGESAIRFWHVGQSQTAIPAAKSAFEISQPGPPEESKGKVSGADGAAAKLGIPASTLESKIKQLKIEKRKFTTAAS